MKNMFLLLLSALTLLSAQLKISSVDKLPVSRSQQWMVSKFSISGNEIYLTDQQYDGIWQYSFVTKLLKEITRDKRSGFEFVVSEDGTKIAYRRTVVEGDHRSRVQEAVEIELKTLHQRVIEKGNSVSTPIFGNSHNATTRSIITNDAKQSLNSAEIKILGIEDSKIVLLKNGIQTILDPITNGKYIWPVISPDKTKFVAVEMDRGAFIADFDGKNVIHIGKCNSPQWSRDGKWIIGMDDKDDGHRIVSSDIIAVSLDGKVRLNLTPSFEGVSMFPACSPTENKIIFSTSDGEIFLLVYEEAE